MIDRVWGLLSRLRRAETDLVEAWWDGEELPSKSRRTWLAHRRKISPDIEKGIYPFGGQILDRADVVWLLKTHNNGSGPVEWNPDREFSASEYSLVSANFGQVQRARAECNMGEFLVRTPGMP